MSKVHLLHRTGRIIGTADRFQAANRRQPAGRARKTILLLKDTTLTRGCTVTLDADLADVLIARIFAAPTGD